MTALICAWGAATAAATLGAPFIYAAISLLSGIGCTGWVSGRLTRSRTQARIGAALTASGILLATWQYALNGAVDYTVAAGFGVALYVWEACSHR